MSGNTFWFCCWILVAVVVVSIPAILAVDDMYGAAKVADMVAHGANPIVARCSIFGSANESRLDCNLFKAN